MVRNELVFHVNGHHNGIFELAIELIDAAVSAGADAVKFQKRDLHSLYPKKYLENTNAGEKTLGYLLPILLRVLMRRRRSLSGSILHLYEVCKTQVLKKVAVLLILAVNCIR